MGYCSAKMISNKKLREKIYEFLRENFRPYEDLMGEESYHVKSEFELGPLDYDTRKNIIGFMYICSNPTVFYMEFILKWMAIKFGTKRKIKHKEYPCYYYTYDGCDKIAVEWERPNEPVFPEWMTTKLNVTAFPKELIETYSEDDLYPFLNPTHVEKIREEIKRLDKLWDKNREL